jgi:magnesium chelatase family protein
MLAKTHSAAIQGVDALAVEVEINATGQGEATIVSIVGLPDTAVKESRERIWSALASSGFSRPKGTTVINMAPADVKKEGAAFDLPIALGVIAASGAIDKQKLHHTMILGELALDGSVRPVKGALPAAILASSMPKVKYLLVPEANSGEARAGAGRKEVYAVSHLHDAAAFFTDNFNGLPLEKVLSVPDDLPPNFPDFAEVKGQSAVKRALEIAAAGGHNLLMIGPPGTGKSMMAKRLPGILPPMTLDETLETSRIHSVMGLLTSSNPLAKARPFRYPHHTISDAGLLGGGTNPAPGEISMAHNGVLFLDELPEFKRSVLEVLRQPLENGCVTVSRAAGSCTFPSRFILVAAMNPCPCGYYGSMQRACRCNPNVIHRYRARISGPLLDRIDLHIEVTALAEDELIGAPTGETSAQIRGRVVAARKIQEGRFAGSGVFCNSRMEPAQLQLHCRMDKRCETHLRHAIREMSLSARAYDRILRTARTIADLEAAESIQEEHIFEAVNYRGLDKRLW